MKSRRDLSLSPCRTADGGVRSRIRRTPRRAQEACRFPGRAVTITLLPHTDMPRAQAMNAQSDDATYCWPQDYVLMDAGRLRVHRTYVDHFTDRGWTRFADVYDDASWTVRRHVDQKNLSDRDNCSGTLPRPGGGPDVQVFAKRHHTRRNAQDQTFLAPGMVEAEAVGRGKKSSEVGFVL